METTTHITRAGRLLAVALATWMAGTVAAHAADGRITFTGAILAPTCTQDVRAPNGPRDGQNQETTGQCGVGNLDKATVGTVYGVKISQLSTAVVDPRVNTYFQVFTPDATLQLATRTYL